MIIQNNMAVICRTREEIEIYVEIATKEGWRSCTGSTLKANRSLPMNYATGFFDEKYPNAVTFGSASKDFPEHLIVVEASDLFRNQLIARRIKHDKRTT